jgi:uncharacterized Zn-binding protein involved in type VI secretion
MRPAARILDPVTHPLPPVLTPGPGSSNVMIGMLPAWRGVPAAVAAALQAAKQVTNIAIKAAEAATVAASGTPGAPAAKLAEETTKATCAAAMGAAISAAAGMADIHLCTTPLPIPPHGPGVVIDGSQTVLINNLPACRMGDSVLEALGPLNKIIMGCTTVLIGDSAASGSSGGGGAMPAMPGPPGLTPPAVPGLPGAPAANIAGMPVSVLPNGDVGVGKSITITGDMDFKLKTLANLGQIAATPTGQKLLRDLGDDKNKTTIRMTTGGNKCTFDGDLAFRKPDGSHGQGSAASVLFNPDKGYVGAKTNKWDTRPPAIGLAHELIHAKQATTGTLKNGSDNNDHKKDPDDPSKTAKTLKAELDAVGIPPYDAEPYSENKIREEWRPKQPQREWY